MDRTTIAVDSGVFRRAFCVQGCSEFVALIAACRVQAMSGAFPCAAYMFPCYLKCVDKKRSEFRLLPLRLMITCLHASASFFGSCCIYYMLPLLSMWI